MFSDYTCQRIVVDYRSSGPKKYQNLPAHLPLLRPTSLTSNPLTVIHDSPSSRSPLIQLLMLKDGSLVADQQNVKVRGSRRLAQWLIYCAL